MSDSLKLSLLSTHVLEESYVLDIIARPGQVRFEMELVLTPSHEDYVVPDASEKFCYKPGTLVFSGVTSCSWTSQGALPARDATGETDYGHIDSFRVEDDVYELEGDWGTMSLVAKELSISIHPEQ